MKERPGFDRREPKDESERSNTAKEERRKVEQSIKAMRRKKVEIHLV